MIDLFNEFLTWTSNYIYGGLTPIQFAESVINTLGFDNVLAIEYSDFINFACTCFYWLIPIVCILFILGSFLVLVVCICRYIVSLFRL